MPIARRGASCPSIAEMRSKSWRHTDSVRAWDTRLDRYDVEECKWAYSLNQIHISGEERRGVAAGAPSLEPDQPAERCRINGVSFGGESRSWLGSILPENTLSDDRSDDFDSVSDFHSISSFAELEPGAARRELSSPTLTPE